MVLWSLRYSKHEHTPVPVTAPCRYVNAFKAKVGTVENMGEKDEDKLLIMQVRARSEPSLQFSGPPATLRPHLHQHLPPSSCVALCGAQMMMKCADVSHPARPWKVHERWSILVTEEFYRQGDRERELGLPISPLCDRNAHNLPKSQLGFIQFVVMGAFTSFSDFCGVEQWVAQLRRNETRWKELAAAGATSTTFPTAAAAAASGGGAAAGAGGEAPGAVSTAALTIARPPTDASASTAGGSPATATARSPSSLHPVSPATSAGLMTPSLVVSTLSSAGAVASSASHHAVATTADAAALGGRVRAESGARPSAGTATVSPHLPGQPSPGGPTSDVDSDAGSRPSVAATPSSSASGSGVAGAAGGRTLGASSSFYAAHSPAPSALSRATSDNSTFSSAAPVEGSGVMVSPVTLPAPLSPSLGEGSPGTSGASGVGGGAGVGSGERRGSGSGSHARGGSGHSSAFPPASPHHATSGTASPLPPLSPTGGAGAGVLRKPRTSLGGGVAGGVAMVAAAAAGLASPSAASIGGRTSPHAGMVKRVSWRDLSAAGGDASGSGGAGGGGDTAAEGTGGGAGGGGV